MEQETTHTDVTIGTDDVVPIGGVPVLRCVADGPLLDSEPAALDLIGATMGRTEMVAVPVARIAPAFFDLSSGVAGAIVQKFANYRVRAGGRRRHHRARRGEHGAARLRPRVQPQPADVVRRGRSGAGGAAELTAVVSWRVGQVTVRTVGAVGNDGPVDVAGGTSQGRPWPSSASGPTAGPGCRAGARRRARRRGGARRPAAARAGGRAHQAERGPWPSPLLPALPGLLDELRRARGCACWPAATRCSTASAPRSPGCSAPARLRVLPHPSSVVAGLRPAGLGARTSVEVRQRGRPAARRGCAGCSRRGAGCWCSARAPTPPASSPRCCRRRVRRLGR